MPKITVYITNHNYGKYVEEAIDSILAQTYRDFELVIIDDGSEDGSREVLSKYKDHPAITLVFQERKGLNASCNVALKHARGEYMIRLDADDSFTPEALEYLVDRIEEDRNTGYVFCDFYETDALGKVKKMIRQFDPQVHENLQSAIPHGACMLIRLSFIQQCGGYNEKYPCQDGTDLWMKFKDKYSPAHVAKPLFYYRRHQNNLSNDQSLIQRIKKEMLLNSI
jgi:glycosyltransferase involved in cell wall biosynthesis